MAERHDDTRVRLLEAAGEVFAEKGFQAATVREICSRAGANVAAVNYHFGDKQRLYVEVMRYAHRGFAEHPLARWAPETPLADKLRAFIEQMLADMQEDAAPSWRRRLMMREMAEPTEACLAVMRAFIQPRREMLREILSEILPSDVPEADRQLIAYSIVGQCLFHRVHWPIVKMMASEEVFRSFDLARLTEHITRFSLAALGQAPGVGQAFQPDAETADVGNRQASGCKA